MEKSFEKFILDKIFQESGIVIAPIHSISICNYVEKFISKNNLTIEEYCESLNKDNNILNDLINQATTNETYFFREEKQFDYLKNELFPKYRYKKLVIWSAACSTGEEPLSLLALALDFNIDVEIYASDIDDNVLSFFREGVYTKYSFRNDGAVYHKYLDKIGSFNEDKSKFTVKPEILNRIKIIKYNLTDYCNFPICKNIDIIFMRNVFIYFDVETRAKITEEVTKKLNENGHLFYSINEIGNINRNKVPEFMVKDNYNHIFFYVKRSSDGTKEKTLGLGQDDNEKPCDVFGKLRLAIVKNDFPSALTIANNYKPTFSDRYFSSFFKGYVLMKQKNYQEAENYFTTSEFLKGDFWPAYYFHGLLLEEKAECSKASGCFEKCYNKIKFYIDNSHKEYDFLFSDKNPNSICSYCSKFVKE